jgi:hypothetical protein
MDAIFDEASGAFSRPGVIALARTLAYSYLLCLGRHTISQTLTTCGRQHVDWTAAYRVFEAERIEEKPLFAPIRKHVIKALPKDAPLVVALDDTALPRRGKHVANAAWHHDAQGPPFAHQIQWSQRIIEIGAYLPRHKEGPGAVRVVPLDATMLDHVARPSSKAGAKAHAEYRQDKAHASAPATAARRIGELRRRLDEEGEKDRALHVAVDGGYTNKAVFRTIPHGTALIGRLRKDARLRGVAPPHSGKGRPRLYGETLDTPAELFANEAVPWKAIELFAAGKTRQFQYKSHDTCCWPGGSGTRLVRVLVLRPLSPNHHKRQRLYFTHPGYIISSDPALGDAAILQAYINRWEIEVGFREQKTVLGLGEAQTRTAAACRSVVMFRAFCYALLLLGASQSDLHLPPRPKWQRENREGQRPTIGQVLGNLRGEIWGAGIGVPTLSHLTAQPHPDAKCPKMQNTAKYAVLYAQR